MNNDQLILNELKSINKRLDGLEIGQKNQGGAIKRLEQGQKDLQTGQKDIRETMVTKEDITEMKIIQLKQGVDTRIIKEDVKTIELKTALIHERNNKDHMEIIDMMIESNEINYQAVNQDVKKLEERITTLEEHTRLSNPIKH